MRKYVLLTIFAALISTSSFPVMDAFASSHIATFNSVEIEFLGCVDLGNTIECSWEGTGTGNTGNAASHITFGIESCLNYIESWSPTADDERIESVELGLDPTTGVTGIKWNFNNFNFNDPIQSMVFTVELFIPMEELELIMVAVKEGSTSTELAIIGPFCPPIVAGELLPISSTALFLAGIQSMTLWAIPAVAGLAGAGIYFAKFRNQKD